MQRTISRAGIAAVFILASVSTSTVPTFANQAGSGKNSTKETISKWQELYNANMQRFEERREELREKRESRTAASKPASQKTQVGISSHRGSAQDRVDAQSYLDEWKAKRDARIAAFRERVKNNAASKEARKKSAAKQAGKPSAGDSYGNLIAKYAAQHGVPYKLARAVVQVESSFRPNVTGAAGEIGLMQIKLSTARGMGYSGSAKQLYDPATNLYWGMKYLGKARQLAGGTTCGTILKYNAGHYAKRSNPVSSRYCRKVQQMI